VAVIDPAKDHFAGRRLVDRGDKDVHGLVNEAAGAVHDHHGAVFEIRDALIDLFAFAKNKDAHAFSGKNGWAKGVGEQIDV
jgi:hypothetical protein